MHYVCVIFYWVYICYFEIILLLNNERIDISNQKCNNKNNKRLFSIASCQKKPFNIINLEFITVSVSVEVSSLSAMVCDEESSEIYMVCVEVNLVVLMEVFELLEVGFELQLASMETWFESP